MKLKQLINCLKIKEITANTDIDTDITGLAIDSKAVLPGGLFICLKGQSEDGHNFYREAAYNGAAALVVQKKLNIDMCQIIVPDSRAAMVELAETFYGYPASKLKMIGISGTNGKTTVSYMIKSILDAAGKNTGIIGTLGIHYANKEIAPELTTPDPICLNATLADMVKCNVECVVTEVSAHAIYYNKTGSALFDVGVFTNLSQDHLDFFKSMDDYKNTKKKFFSPSYIKAAVLNFDDQTGREFAAQCNVPFVSYALNNPSDVFAVNIEQSVGGSSFVINLFDEICAIRLRLLGVFNISNALAAASACRIIGIDTPTVAKGLLDLKSVNGRLEYAGNYNGADIFVDFAHTPDGLSAVLQSLRALNPKRLICLFGCGGNRDKSKRRLMGETVGRLSDYAVVTSDNPRFEDPLDIISDIEQGLRAVSKKYVTVQERKCAVKHAIELLAGGDILIIAGKGGETYQEIMGIKHAYNDNAVVSEILQNMKNNV